MSNIMVDPKKLSGDLGGEFHRWWREQFDESKHPVPDGCYVQWDKDYSNRLFLELVGVDHIIEFNPDGPEEIYLSVFNPGAYNLDAARGAIINARKGPSGKGHRSYYGDPSVNAAKRTYLEEVLEGLLVKSRVKRTDSSVRNHLFDNARKRIIGPINNLARGR